MSGIGSAVVRFRSMVIREDARKPRRHGGMAEGGEKKWLECQRAGRGESGRGTGGSMLEFAAEKLAEVF